MAIELLYILISVVGVSLISLIGLFVISFKEDAFNKILNILVAFAAGTLLGTAFLGLLPEAVEQGTPFYVVLAGLVLFFVIERFIHWHHCHDKECDYRTAEAVGKLNLIGDGVHNLIDGIIIAATFMIDVRLGITTSIAIALHEIPQEIGDFAILIHSGYTRKKALLYNFYTALVAVVGAVLTYWFASSITGIVPYLAAIAAGGFIYIATADLLPELHKESSTKKLILQFIFFILGIVIIWFVVNFLPS